MAKRFRMATGSIFRSMQHWVDPAGATQFCFKANFTDGKTESLRPHNLFGGEPLHAQQHPKMADTTDDHHHQRHDGEENTIRISGSAR